MKRVVVVEAGDVGDRAGVAGFIEHVAIIAFDAGRRPVFGRFA
jgi:hypothetical protein